MKIKPVFDVPSLKIDKTLFSKREMPAHCKLERRIIYNLCLHLYANGFRLHSVFDGEEVDDGYTVEQKAEVAIKQAMELVFNLDEASIRFISQSATNNNADHGVLYIGGNGVDCIADWNYFSDDSDGFNKVMDEFNPDDYT
jgi:hypothetical protein